MTGFEPGDHFYELERWGNRRPEGAHIWRTLGFNRTLWEPGHQVIEWKATEDYSFPSLSGHIVHGGMVSTILDTAMGGAAWSLLNNDEAFLTANLSVDFLRATRPGLLRAEGRVISRTKRAVFCEADLFDEDGKHTATARCTQIILPSEGPAGRTWQGKDPGTTDT